MDSAFSCAAGVSSARRARGACGARVRRRAHSRALFATFTGVSAPSGVVKALPLLGNNAFFVFNCDAITLDGATPMLSRMRAAWNPNALDVLMLVTPMETAHGFDGAGDFFVESDGTMKRRGTAPRAPYIYAGVTTLHPRALAGEPAAPFSMNKVWDKALAAGRMKALIHDGAWYHVGTPEAVSATEKLLGS